MTEQQVHRKLHRVSGTRALGGVAQGIAEHLNLSPVVIRLAFAALTLAGGMGVLMYAALWIVVPQEKAPASSPPLDGRGQLIAVGALGVGLLLLLNAFGVLSATKTLLPVALSLGGLALIWQQADDAQRRRWVATADGSGALGRVLAGAMLLSLGLTGFLASRGQLGAARQGLLSTLVVVVGLALLSGPFWLRTASDLRAERRARIRSQERADIAAHVHDSVLQTLALIQRAADEPREVTRLARAQERELRSWLYRPTTTEVQFAEALERAGTEVEEAHRMPVEVVVVGDCPADERATALVASAKEAMVNAAKHSGADLVQVYAEVEPGQVTVFVRDRGCGFDPDAVPEDRFGLAQSVVGRMARAGGVVRLRSSPGTGTEVTLELPRA